MTQPGEVERPAGRDPGVPVTWLSPARAGTTGSGR
jgi:hypothetical protein